MKLTELQKKLGERMSIICRDDLKPKEMMKEIERSKVVASLGREMVRNAHMIMSAKKATGSLNKDFVEELI